MKRVLVIVRCLVLISILLTGCLSAVQKDDGPVEVQVKNHVVAKVLPLHLWATDNDPNTVPVRIVERSESRIILPESLSGDIEDIVLKIKEIIYTVNSRASVEIKDNAIIIKNIYEGNPDHKIYAKDILMPEEMKSITGVRLLLTETTWATMNTYPEVSNNNKSNTGVNYEVCTIEIGAVSINIIHGTLGVRFFSNGEELSLDMESINKPELASWKKCRDN